jgi:hypothetical protein
MGHHAGANHIQVNVNQTPHEVIVTLHGGCMVAVLPECALSVLSLVILLSCSSRNELERPGDYVPAPVVEEKKMHVV